MDPVTPVDVSAKPNDIYANLPDSDRLELEDGHPGLLDTAYVARRQELFTLCRPRR